eukprot:scaffold19450_cov20-Tisochrysis_lutea.AAC.3
MSWGCTLLTCGAQNMLIQLMLGTSNVVGVHTAYLRCAQRAHPTHAWAWPPLGVLLQPRGPCAPQHAPLVWPALALLPGRCRCCPGGPSGHPGAEACKRVPYRLEANNASPQEEGRLKCLCRGGAASVQGVSLYIQENRHAVLPGIRTS